MLRPEAIGQILDCPKCGSMVQIVPPEGWVPPESDPAAAGAYPSNLRTGPPPLDKVGETYLALGAAEEVSNASLWQRLFTFVKVKIVWICAGAGAVAVVLTLWAVWAAAPAGQNSKPADPVILSEAQNLVGENVPHQSLSNTGEILRSAQDDKVVLRPAQDEKEKSTTSSPAVPSPDQSTAQVPKLAAAPPAAEKPAESVPAHPSPPAKAPAPEPAGTPILPETSAVRLVKMVVPEATDVDQRLGTILPEVELTKMPLARALALVSSLANVPLTIDPEALRLKGVSPRDPVSLHLHDASLEQFLEAIAAERGLAADAGEGQVWITLSPEDREDAREVRYKVDDLCPDQRALESLATTVRALVAPTTWRAHGGEAVLQAENGALRVTHCDAVQQEILLLCEKLRLARGLRLQSKLPPSRFPLTTPSARARPALQRNVSANFHQPAPLVQILGDLAAQAGVDILIDRRGLAAENMTDNMEVSYVVEDKPLGASLRELLRPLKLDFRPLDATTLQVTTPQALQACRQIEFYSVGKLLAKNRDAAELIGRIKTTIAPDSWRSAGKTVAIEFDPSSQALIVLQSPPIQAAVEEFLSRME